MSEFFFSPDGDLECEVSAVQVFTVAMLDKAIAQVEARGRQRRAADMRRLARFPTLYTLLEGE